jgi:hypothetical protein
MPSGTETSSTPRAEGSTRQRLRARLFPGDPTVWRVALVLGLGLAALILLETAVVKREYFTGTNSVAARNVIATPKPGQRLCVGNLDIPRGTGAVRFGVRTRRPGARLALTLTTGATRTRGTSPEIGGGRSDVDIPAPSIRVTGESDRGSVCAWPAPRSRSSA